MRFRRFKRLEKEQEKEDCDICGFKFNRSELVRQDGQLKCSDCVDEPSYKDHVRGDK